MKAGKIPARLFDFRSKCDRTLQKEAERESLAVLVSLNAMDEIHEVAGMGLLGSLASQSSCHAGSQEEGAWRPAAFT